MLAVTVMSLFWTFTVLLYVRYIQCEDFCGKLIAVNGIDGDNVTLHVYKNNIHDVTWSYRNNRIASTEPQKPINVTSTYRGKLASDQDGSLVIMNLRKEDEGTYDASIKLRTEDLCTVHYHLQVYQRLSVDDIKITHNVLSHEPCHMILTCTASGSNVTITWTCGDMNVTHNVVNVTDPKTQYTCTAHNPISNSSKSITPREYCEIGRTRWIVVIVLIGVTIIIISAGLYLYFKQKRR
ncbi:hypothetical protein PRIEUP_LOCUS10335, partial [Pristimantis euphronides]